MEKITFNYRIISYVILLVSSVLPSIVSGHSTEMDTVKRGTTHRQNRLGINLNSGVGFEQMHVFKLDDGEFSNISFGGGQTVGIKYARIITPYIDLAIDFNYHHSNPSPNPENAKARFSRGAISFTSSFVAPIGASGVSNLRIGVGIDLYSSGSLKIKASQLTNGFNAKWHYRGEIGYHLKAVGSTHLTEELSMEYGMKLYSGQWTLDSQGFDQDQLKNGFHNPSGWGLDMLFGFYYHF